MLVLTAGEKCSFNEVLKVCRSPNEFNRCKGKSPALWAALASSPVSLPTEHGVTNKTFLQQSIFIQANLVIFPLKELLNN